VPATVANAPLESSEWEARENERFQAGIAPRARRQTAGANTCWPVYAPATGLLSRPTGASRVSSSEASGHRSQRERDFERFRNHRLRLRCSRESRFSKAHCSCPGLPSMLNSTPTMQVVFKVF